ncbi:P-loop containing nucleoside triphosphate hydrolases superfamily protein [Rhynchospora pubera]|uniref:P-loop containing nucleoside triphosphate hydrolases superfamily protein n=1 Tax=Rhynchospora pubera TaxID=906938 RepID=A0AAV8FVC5_9POAL|nr:P-loop containing nucleoside triphosphate hydrolases superfamily protein [Rhynchospora pubera]
MAARRALSGAIESVLIPLVMVKDHIPFPLMDFFSTMFRKVLSVAYPYNEITINEYRGQYMQRDELYTAAEAYLSSACSSRARKLKAELGKDSDMPVLTIDDDEEVTDTFKGTRVWWYTRKRPAASFSSITFYPKNEDSKYYRLSFHKRRRKLIEDEYLKHILQEGRGATMHKRQQRLFTNNPSSHY